MTNQLAQINEDRTRSSRDSGGERRDGGHEEVLSTLRDHEQRDTERLRLVERVEAARRACRRLADDGVNTGRDWLGEWEPVRPISSWNNRIKRHKVLALHC